MVQRREALLITGVFGAGKSSAAASMGTGIEGLTMPNDRPIREVAADILDWLGWA